MNPPPTIEQVDSAVKAVLAGLRRPTAAGPPGTHAFSGRLLAERHVEAIDPSSTSIGLSPGTVVTPLARDLLKRRGIAIRFLHQSLADRTNAGEWGFAIEGDSGLGATLRRALLTGTDRWDEVETTLAADWVAKGADRGIAVLTPHAALAVWKAHQVPGVRAASSVDAESLSRAIDDLGINLLAIDPGGQTLFSIKHLLTVFRRRGAPKAPFGGGIGHEDRRGDRPIDLLADAPQPAPRASPHHAADAFARLAGGLNGAGRGGRGL
ncbi:MAG: hypothetical protein U0800_21220 [Isosphaeraceae bacterium]